LARTTGLSPVFSSIWMGMGIFAAPPTRNAVDEIRLVRASGYLL
jgi:hypothetical protein